MSWAGRQANDVSRNAVALPAESRLEQRVDAAEAGGVPDDAGSGLDGARRARAAGDVEGEEAAEAAVEVARRDRVAETRIAHALHPRVGLQPARELERRLRPPLDAEGERRQAAEQEPCGVGRGDDPAPAAEVEQPLAGSVARDEGAEQQVVVAAEVLGDAVDDEVGAVVEAAAAARASPRSRRRRRACRAARRRPARRGRGRTGAGSTASRARRAARPPARAPSGRTRPRGAPSVEDPQQHSRSVVSVLRERHGGAGLEQGERRGRDRAGAGRVEEGRTSLELAERALGLDAGGVRVARVEEGAGVAALVRPHRRAVEGRRAVRHGHDHIGGRGSTIEGRGSWQRAPRPSRSWRRAT